MPVFVEHAAVNRMEGDVPEGTSGVLTRAEFEALNRAGVPTRGLLAHGREARCRRRFHHYLGPRGRG